MQRPGGRNSRRFFTEGGALLWEASQTTLPVPVVSPSLCPSSLSIQDSLTQHLLPSPPAAAVPLCLPVRPRGAAQPLQKGSCNPSLKTLLSRGWSPGGVRIGRSHRLEA